jgi:hypothetical protein
MIGWRQDAVLMFRGAYQVVFVIAEFCPTSEDLTPLPSCPGQCPARGNARSPTLKQ